MARLPRPTSSASSVAKGSISAPSGDHPIRSSRSRASMAYAVFRNYDGAKSTFGDQAVTSTSSDQGKLSVYGALRTKDNTLTLVILNKTYGEFTTTLSLANFTPNGPAQAFLYSSANLNAIVAQPNLTVTAPSGTGTTSTLSTTFPAQSITVLSYPRPDLITH